MSQANVAAAARTIESLPGVPPMLIRRTTRAERQARREQLKRFLALPPELQEGILRYGENIRQSHTKQA